jgi:heavy metal translocating P-type ATPase
MLARRFASDIVASLAVIGAVAFDQPIAGLVIVVMQTGGEALERYAEGRASGAVRELENAAPRVAHRLDAAGIATDVPAADVGAGDRLLVRPGELIPADGVVEAGRSTVDAARLTGEPMPVNAGPGTRLMSGAINGDGPLTLRATAAAAESEYARVVELVRSAQASKAPLQRAADRYAVWFTPITLLVCGAAWLVSRDPSRVLAVLVVATPCPLILAAPVAIIGGFNRAARRHIIFRHGAALERLAAPTVVALDKTGTVTIGRPEVAAVRPASPFGEDELLRLAAAVEHGSGHLLARTLHAAAVARLGTVPNASAVREEPGAGVTGTVDGREVTIGGWSYVTGRHPPAAATLAALRGPVPGLLAYVTVDGRAGGVVEYADALRPGAATLVHDLEAAGVGRVILLSGDAPDNVARVAAEVGVREARGGLLPEDKAAIITELVRAGETVVMVGDGVNDAPALTAASVGVALPSGGGGIAAEAADAVLLADDPRRLLDAIGISRRTLRIARQSMALGLALSGVAMAAAALGWIRPTAGALIQEAIDVAAIVNALRASAAPVAAAARRR